MTRERDLGTVFEARVSRRGLMVGGVAAGAAMAVTAGPRAFQRAAAQGTTGGTLRLPLGAATNTDLNPIGVRTLGAFYLQSCIYDGLVCSSASWDEVEPALAETWDISEDGLTYTFNLRKGVTWHDGQPFTSADVAFTYKTILTKAVGSYFANSLTTIAGAQAYLDGTADAIEGIKAVDESTIQFVLTEPNAPFAFSILTQHSIIPEHVWKDVTPEDLAKPGTWEKGQIGTGPFKFVQYQPDQFLELERYDDAWRGAPLLDKILFVVVGTTPEATAAALENGDLDYATVPSTEFEVATGLQPEWVDAANLVVSYWKAVGIDVQLKPEDRSLLYTRKEANDCDCVIWGGDGGLRDAMLETRWYFPSSTESNYAQAWAVWYNPPANPQTTPEEPPAEPKKQTELYEQLKATADAAQQVELFKQILQIAQEQFYVIGISLPAPSYGIAKNNFKNVPASMPGAWLYPNPAPTNPCQYYIEEA